MRTQEDKILNALKNHPEGLHPTYIIGDLHIYQYNARLKGLRDRFGCICKNGNTVCPAEEHIINKRLSKNTTKFFYKETPHIDYHQQIQEEKADIKRDEPQQALF